MQYEVYADLLFLQYFGLNMMLLGCLNRRFSHTATWGRLLFAAGAGALCTTLDALQIVPFLLSKTISLVGTLCMFEVSFPGACRDSFSRFAKEALVWSFYLGGGFLAIRQVCLWLKIPRGMLCVGMLPVGIGLLLAAPVTGSRKNSYPVILKHQGRSVETIGFVDTGNTLTEPISGKPVIILDAGLMEQLLQGTEAGFRVIPYHSIGKEHGLLKGYCIEELRISVDGGTKKVPQVYAAAAPEGISLPGKYKGEKADGKEKIGLLLQPRILQ